MTNSTEDMEVIIEEYLDGRLDDRRRSMLEERMKNDAGLRKRVETATHSFDLIRSALIKVDPGNDFEDKVSSQIISITQSNQSIRPAIGGHGGKLTAKDPDAKLIHDPEARKEQQRLMVLAGAAAVIFAIAVALIVMSALGHDDSRNAPKPPAGEHTR